MTAEPEATERAGVFCTKCGGALGPDAVFCGGCGHKR
jgi:ribosomal protein L40E